jgi:outer membrane protein OmpU
MKKILLASTVLAMTATVAAADVTMNGYGRFGLDYNEETRNLDGTLVAGASSTQLNMRMRVNIDANMETDGGVAFGGRVRLQYDDGDVGTEVSPAQLYVTYSGLRVEVGNVDTAADSVALAYNSEIGYLDRSFGDPIDTFFAFASGPYGDDDDRMGVAAAYSISGVNLRMSYVDPDQTNDSNRFTKSEFGIAADYNFGQVTVAASYTDNVGGVDSTDQWFLGAEYAVSDVFSVGLLHFNSNYFVGDSERTTLYGSYTMDAITIKGYVAHDTFNGANFVDVDLGPILIADNAFGLGVDYDLGGARLSGDIHRNYSKDVVAGLGVRFDF